MQQPMGYPVFWTNEAQRPPVLTHASMYPPPLPPFPDFRKKRRKDGTCVYLFIVFLLVLLALVGVGIGTYKIMELQKELDRVKEVQNVVCILFYFYLFVGNMVYVLDAILLNAFKMHITQEYSFNLP